MGRHVNSFETHGRARSGVPLVRKGFRGGIAEEERGERVEKQTMTSTCARSLSSSSLHRGKHVYGTGRPDKFGFLCFPEADVSG